MIDTKTAPGAAEENQIGMFDAQIWTQATLVWIKEQQKERAVSREDRRKEHHLTLDEALNKAANVPIQLLDLADSLADRRVILPETTVNEVQRKLQKEHGYLPKESENICVDLRKDPKVLWAGDITWEKTSEIINNNLSRIWNRDTREHLAKMRRGDLIDGTDTGVRPEEEGHMVAAAHLVRETIERHGKTLMFYTTDAQLARAAARYLDQPCVEYVTYRDGGQRARWARAQKPEKPLP